MSAHAKLPSVTYDPRLVARAALFAAATPRRELTVGGFGAEAVIGNLLAPRILDSTMAAFGTRIQQTDHNPQSRATDNLYEHRVDGAIKSNEPQYVRRQSLWLEAQMLPLAALALIGVAGGTIVALTAAIRQRR